LIVAGWSISDWFLDLGSLPWVRRACRDLGYLALLAMLVPYLYVWRRLYLFRYFGNMTTLIRWHIGTAYLAVALTLVHCRGRLFGDTLTTWAVVAFAAVVLSGVIGYFAQKAVYRIMSLVIKRELGRADLTKRRGELLRNSTGLVENYSLLVAQDILDWHAFCSMLLQERTLLNLRIFEHKTFSRNSKEVIEAIRKSPVTSPDQVRSALDALNQQLWRQNLFQTANTRGLKICDELSALLGRRPQELLPREVERRNRLILEAACPDLIKLSQPPPQTVTRFFKEEVLTYLNQPVPSWRWLFTQAALEPVPRNHYLRILALTPKDQAGVIDQLWASVEERRQIDLEYWFHRLARVWLLVHGPVSAALLVLVVFHVYSSIYYGGFF